MCAAALIATVIRAAASKRLAWSVAALAGLCLSGCGTTSGLKLANGKSAADLARLNKVVIRDFADKASEKINGAKQTEKRDSMARVTRDFADMLSGEIERTGAFKSVSRTNIPDGDTLLIEGAVTRYEEGSAAARLWIGLGAGSSYFDAVVEFHDGSSDALLGTILVDKNSWVLGGGLAAGQTPEGFMREAAHKVAEELRKAKPGQMSAKSRASQ